MPHIPLVPEFWEFSRIGRALSDLHLNYENQPFPKTVKILKDGQEINISQLQNPLHFKSKDKAFSKQILKNQTSFIKDSENHSKNEEEKTRNENQGQKEYSLPKGVTPENLKVQKMKIDKNDKSKIQFNQHITIANIPKSAYEYKINGYSTPKWIVERYQLKRDKKTDLINDPNTYSEDPAYILKLLLSIITVSLKTQELVQSLPPIDFDSLIPFDFDSLIPSTNKAG